MLHASDAFQFPEPREITPSRQVGVMIKCLQEEGLTGIVSLDEILHRYPEYCLMHGWIPLSERSLSNALCKRLKRVRPLVHGKRLTAWRVPGTASATIVNIDDRRAA